jgi:hypothetical protein
VQTRKEPAPGNLEGTKGVLLSGLDSVGSKTVARAESYEVQNESDEMRVRSDLNR